MKKMNVILVIILVILSCFSLNLVVAAVDYPTKPITLYIPYSAGGTTDTSARVLASAAEKILGRPIICVNKTGGGGTVMMGLLKNEKPDGYTLGIIPTPTITRTPHILDVEYDGFKDFSFIMKYGLYTMFLVVNGDSPFNTFGDFVDAAKKNPGKISFSTPGPMEAGVLVPAAIANIEKLEWNAVPFPGSGEGMTALFGKHVDAFSGAGGVETHLSQVKSGELKVLATYNDVRSPAVPEVPTLMELGYDIAIRSGIAIGGPAGISEEIIEVLEDAFLKAMDDPDFIEVTNRILMPTIKMNSKQLKESLEKDYVILGDLLKEIGF